MKKIFLVFIITISTVLSAQQSAIFKIRKYRVSYLDEKIQETSGLSILNGKLYTLNDSGNAPELFELDKTTGAIISTIKRNTKRS
jgi:CBS domain containing-hemolysin-like protein